MLLVPPGRLSARASFLTRRLAERPERSSERENFRSERSRRSAASLPIRKVSVTGPRPADAVARTFSILAPRVVLRRPSRRAGRSLKKAMRPPLCADRAQTSAMPGPVIVAFWGRWRPGCARHRRLYSSSSRALAALAYDCRRPGAFRRRRLIDALGACRKRRPPAGEMKGASGRASSGRCSSLRQNCYLKYAVELQMA